MNAHTLDKRLVSLVLAILLLGAAVAAAVYFWPRAQEMARITYYVCPDDSYYLVVQEQDGIRVAGLAFASIPNSSPVRYGNGGGTEFQISEEGLTAINTEDGTAGQTCVPQAPEVDFVVDAN